MTSLFTYDFSTLYTISPHNSIKEKLDLINRVKREETLYLACNDKISSYHRRYKLWSCQNVSDALSYMYILDNIYIKIDTQVVGIPMGTNCAPLVADLLLFCYERDFMTSLSDDN